MKRYIACFLIVVFAFALAACDAEPAPGTSSAGTASEVSDSVVSDKPVVTDSNVSTETAPVTDTGKTTDTKTEEAREMIPHKLVALTDQKNDEIVVLDLDAEDLNSSSAVVWSWNATRYGDVDYPKRSNRRLDDVKLRHCDAWGGDVIGVTSSSGLIALVAYPSGVCLFNDDAAGTGPHSIEILPNGLIAVACSGNSNAAAGQIRLYSAMSKRDNSYVSDSLSSAHGVCWDPENEVLWALGGSEIRAYAIDGTREKPKLVRIQDMGMKISGGGHDLSPVYGNPDRLWVTYSQGVGQYSKSENKIYHGYAGSNVINMKSCKSVNSFTDGTVVWTVADKNNKTAEHNTNVLNIFTYVQGNSGKWLERMRKEEFSSRDFYKVRAFLPDYQ